MNPYVIGGVTLVIGILGWQLKSSLVREGEYKANLITQAQETVECADSNLSNLKTIATVKEQMLVMINERRIDAELREAVMDERDQLLARARIASDELQDEREDEIDENPDCADLASLSVGFFCPAAGEQLRERSSGSGGDQD